MIYALCVCVLNLLKIYTNLPVGKSMHIYRKRAPKNTLTIGPRGACVSFSVPLAIFFRTITIVRRINEPPGPREWVGVGNEDDGRQTPDPEGLPGRRVISDPRIPTRPFPARLGL